MSRSDRAVDQSGMTLVEMMVAVLIIGLVLSALASALVTTLRSVRGQEAATQATAAINDILEETQRVNYDLAVLCDTTATTVFGGSTFEGEDLVLSSAVCGADDEVLPERTVTRDGRTYDVRTAITWADDPGDGTGSSDPDTTQDVKRMVVDVTWTTDGRTRTARNMAFRAPQFLEQLVTAEVTPDDGSKFVVIADDSDDDGENAESFTLRAYGREKLSKVSVSWVDRNGDTETHPLTATASDGLVWEFQLLSNFGPFANGGTLFTFSAESTTGETETVAARGLFLYDPMAVIPSSGGQDIQRNFDSTLRIGPDGAVCDGQELWIDIEGAIRSDVATATWSNGPSVPDSMRSVTAPDAVALRGARFHLDLSGREEFATYDSDTDSYVPVASHTLVDVNVERVVDGTTTSKELDNISLTVVDEC